MAILSPKASEYQDSNMTLDKLPAKCGQRKLDMARNTKIYPNKLIRWQFPSPGKLGNIRIYVRQDKKLYMQCKGGRLSIRWDRKFNIRWDRLFL